VPEALAQPDRYDLDIPIRGDTTIERTWVEPSFEHIATVSEGDDYTLHNPFVGEVNDDGTAYIVDVKDRRIKAFTSSGEYVATYGEGPGPNPGEITRPTDIGLQGDSLVYVADPQLRKVSYFAQDGSFVRADRYETSPYQVAWTDASVQYIVPPPPEAPPFMQMTTPDREQQVALPLSIESPVMLDGMLHPIGDKAVFVMRYLPVMLTYSPDDLAGTAFPTPDYGEDLPSPQRGGRMVPQMALNGRSTVSGGTLSIQVPASEDGHLAFDLYDIDSMAYVQTIQFPIEVDRAMQGRAEAEYAHGPRSLVVVKDANVHFYRVTMP
jgi:hypothetical protein